MSASRRAVLMVGLALWPVAIHAQESAPGHRWKLFPDSSIVRPFPADGAAHRFAAARSFRNGDVLAQVGGVVPVIGGLFEGTPVQAGFGASVRTRLDPDEHIAVHSIEFAVDLLLVEVEWFPGFQTRFTAGHESHHLGDGLPDSVVAEALDHSRDFISLTAIGEFHDLGLRAYAGMNYAYGFVVGRPRNERTVLHTGFAVAVPVGGVWWVYAAGDVRFREELSFGTTQRYETGIEVRGGFRSLRLGLWHVAGFDDRGQFPGQARKESGAGIFLDL